MSRQAIPSPIDIITAFEKYNVHITDTGAHLLVERITEVLKAGGLYSLHTLSDNRGISMILMDSADGIIDQSMFRTLAAKDKRWKVPEIEWLNRLMEPYNRRFSVEQSNNLRRMIKENINLGGSWEAVIGNGHVTILFYDMFNETSMTIKVI